jgi:hypothetical protein
MKNTIINIDFKGYIQVAFKDLKIINIENEVIDLSQLKPKQVIKGIKSGLYFIQFVENYDIALDGETDLEASIEEEEEGQDRKSYTDDQDRENYT